MSSCVYITPGASPAKVFCNDLPLLARTAADSDIAWVNCIVADVRAEAEALSERFGFNPYVVKRLLEGRYSSFHDEDNQVGLMLPSIQVKHGKVHAYPVVILLRYGLVLTIQDRHITRFSQYAKYAEPHFKKVPANWSRSDKITAILIRLIDENNNRNYSVIRQMGEIIDKLGKLLASKKFVFEKITKDTYSLKHTMVQFQTILWENCDVMRSIQHGDAMLISSRPEFMERFDRFVEENSVYLQLGENLGNLLGSGSEAMQDYYAIHLLRFNNILSFTGTWLSILGTIFLVPNTIATALAASAYSLGTADAGWYTAMLFISTLVSCYITYKGFQRIWSMTRDRIETKWALRTAAAWKGSKAARDLKMIQYIQGTGK